MIFGTNFTHLEGDNGTFGSMRILEENGKDGFGMVSKNDMNKELHGIIYYHCIYQSYIYLELPIVQPFRCFRSR